MSGPRDIAKAVIRRDHKVDTKSVRRGWGTVASIQTGPPKSLTLTIGASTLTTPGIRYLKSYTPTINDVVVIDIDGSDYLVLGILA